MMLEHLRLETAANAVKNAVASLLAGGGPKSPDLGGTAATKEIGNAVVERIQNAS